MNLREIQKPLKDSYRAEPERALITLVARASQSDLPVACSLYRGPAAKASGYLAGTTGIDVTASRARTQVTLDAARGNGTPRD